MSDAPSDPSRSQLAWFFAGAAPFIVSIGLLGYSLTTQSGLAFTIFWPILQVFGYAMSLKMAEGDPAHYLVKTQVILHWMIVFLVIALMLRGES